MIKPKDAFYALIESRQSIRKFFSQPVPEAVLQRILAAAIRAPSAHNRQPWRFVVLQSRQAMEDLVAAMGAKLKRDLQANGVDSAEITARLQRRNERILGAPTAILVCMDRDDIDKTHSRRHDQAEETMMVQSVALAGGVLLQAAHAESLGACWICAPLFAPEESRRALDLPNTWVPQYLIILGEPDEPGRGRGRRPLNEVTLWR